MSRVFVNVCVHVHESITNKFSCSTLSLLLSLSRKHKQGAKRQIIIFPVENPEQRRWVSEKRGGNETVGKLYGHWTH